jgi:heme-degrading monooxygenase HmoA
VYVTIRNYAGNSEIVDRLVSRADEVKQLITGISGFQAYYLVRTDGGGVSVSVYDSRDGADESNRQAAEFIRSNFPDLASASPQVSAGETVITA